jgi:hypothetical protein
MLEKLTRNARKNLEKQQIEAMQHYLDYLKSDEGIPVEETTVSRTLSRQWPVSPVMYPPFED